MQRTWIKTKELIKQQDLFGVPVQLTYKGERAFNTAFGGCLSLLLIVGMTTYFVFSFLSTYNNPQYNSTPPSIDYSK